MLLTLRCLLERASKGAQQLIIPNRTPGPIHQSAIFIELADGGDVISGELHLLRIPITLNALTL